jgi:RNA polymerase sigma factor (sigma-70 family)
VDELVPIHTPMLWQVARAAGLGQQDAEDVVQTVWVSLLSHLDSIRSPEALTGWLVTATRREAWRVTAAARKTQPADHEFLVEIPDPRADCEERVLAAEEQRALWAALRTLDPRCQELLRIVAFVPRPDYDLVAERLRMRRGSVGPTRLRCLDKLRLALRGEHGRKEALN